MTKSLDIVLCTWNRAPLLQATLESILACEVPPNWVRRILVVDNGSTDTTPQIIRDFSSRFPEIVPLFEQRLGHTHARNCAVQRIAGDLVLWTDDDVEVPVHWVASYVTAFEQMPASSFWGAAITPEFIDGKPHWISENWSACSGCFAARDLGKETVEFTPEQLPYGANFAVRGSVQKQFLYDPKLGRVGPRITGEDELDFFRRLLKSGHRGFWIGNNGLKHRIPKERATIDYVWRYFVGQGFRLGLRQPESRWRLRRILLGQAILFWLKRPFVSSQVWFAHLACWALAQGRLEAQQEIGRHTA